MPDQPVTLSPDRKETPAGPTVTRQQEEEKAVEGKSAALQLKDTVDRFLLEQRMHDFRHKPETGQTAHIRLEPDTGQTAYTPRWQKTGSAMQMES